MSELGQIHSYRLTLILRCAQEHGNAWGHNDKGSKNKSKSQLIIVNTIKINHSYSFLQSFDFFILFASIGKQMNRFAVIIGHRRITIRIIFPFKAPWWPFGNILLFMGWKRRKKHRFVGIKNF